MPKTLEVSEVVLYLLATTIVLMLMGVLVMQSRQHQLAVQESHFMGCKYLGKLNKNVYAFECGQNIVLKHL